MRQDRRWRRAWTYDPTTAGYWQPAPRPDDGDEPPEQPDPDGPDRSRVILALGIVALFIGPLGIVTWALANRALHAVEAGQLDPCGEVNLRAARVLGILATCMFLVKLFALLPIYVFVFGD
jgi:hypothetical protein